MQAGAGCERFLGNMAAYARQLAPDEDVWSPDEGPRMAGAETLRISAPTFYVP